LIVNEKGPQPIFPSLKSSQWTLAFLLLGFAGGRLPEANAASCMTQSQITPIQRVTLIECGA
jgi:hypothetical protein